MSFLKRFNKDSLKESLDAGLKSAQDGVAGINVGEMVQGARDAVIDSVANFNPEELVQGAKEAVAAGAEMAGNVIGGALRDDTEEVDTSLKELVALLWCLAYVDGVVTSEERDLLTQISSEIDASYETYAAEIESECIARLQEASREFGQENASKIEASRIIETVQLDAGDAKLLCWNLLTLANSDDLNENELDFIRYIAEKSGVETSIFDELRNYSDALLEVEKSIEQLKLSDRSYSEIEPLVDEAMQRQQYIFGAAQTLISDR